MPVERGEWMGHELGVATVRGEKMSEILMELWQI
jgi:hypothetical protein